MKTSRYNILLVLWALMLLVACSDSSSDESEKPVAPSITLDTEIPPVIVLGVVSAVCSGSSVVSCQFQIDIPPFQQLGVEKRSSGAAGSAAILRQIIPSRI